MTTTDVERAAHAATEALAKFDRAGIYEVMQTVPALAQALRELLATVTTPTPPADDVREALAEAWQLGFGAGFIDRHRALPDENGDCGATLPLPNPYGEVRPHGTVTDAERPYSEAVDIELGAWETDDIEERALDLLTVVARRRKEGRS
ncbi:hypothetical protein C1632_02535 [Microbacterium testaceum]|uniref:hypothetical protein n=1 Tax=Microbacterium testaceum TaxID=2033 RepID=UPI000CCE60C8|nr:hypothetical protein [Microbacterium testaceum]PNW10656.1 hypothetical protein C1632_02535 [Microbacterium testaceum]